MVEGVVCEGLVDASARILEVLDALPANRPMGWYRTIVRADLRDVDQSTLDDVLMRLVEEGTVLTPDPDAPPRAGTPVMSTRIVEGELLDTCLRIMGAPSRAMREGSTSLEYDLTGMFESAAGHVGPASAGSLLLEFDEVGRLLRRRSIGNRSDSPSNPRVPD